MRSLKDGTRNARNHEPPLAHQEDRLARIRQRAQKRSAPPPPASSADPVALRQSALTQKQPLPDQRPSVFGAQYNRPSSRALATIERCVAEHPTAPPDRRRINDEEHA